MLKYFTRIIRIALPAAIFIGSVSIAVAQIPSVDRSVFPDDLNLANQWISIGSYHVAHQELLSALSNLHTVGEIRDGVFILMESSFEDQEYEDAFQWAVVFLNEYPNDARRSSALFMRGVSAFQTRRLNDSRTALDAFINRYPHDEKRGAAYFWLAMEQLDRGEWQSAETDLRSAYEDSPEANYKDVALMGLALSLERRAAYADAIRFLEKFLTEFPQSSLLPEVKIRLASLSLRVGDSERATNLLRGTQPSKRTGEEYSLLRAEADMRLAQYEKAQVEYEDFVNEFSGSRFARKGQFNVGWARLKRHDYAGAQQVFDSLGVGNDSLAFASLYESGILAFLQNRPNDAEARLDSLTDRSPYDAYAEQAYFQLGMEKYREKHYREARRYFELAARMFPGSSRQTQSYRMLGETNVALSDFSNAQFAFRQVSRLGASDDLLAPSLFQEGICLYHLGRFKSSAQILENFLNRFPKDSHSAEGYVWKGEALYQDYRFDEAERAYTDALRLYPMNPKRSDAAYGLAWSMFEQKKFSQAANAFERFAKDYPDSKNLLDASLRCADCYFFMGRYEKADSMYAGLASERADSRTIEYAAFQVAMSYIQRGESDRGIQELRNFLAKFPSSIYDEVVQFNIGWEYFSLEEYPAAVTEFRTLMQKYPDSQLMQRVLFNMGDAFYNLKQYDSARSYYHGMIKNFPQSLLVPDALNGLQFAYEAEGKPAGAIAEIDTLLKNRSIQTPTEELQLRKGDILFGQGDFGGAVQEYQRVLSANPSRPVQAKALHQLGRTFELENNLPRAISFYKQVVKDFPETDVAPAAALALGIADIKIHQDKDAIGVLDSFDHLYPESPLRSEVQYYDAVARSNSGDKHSARERFQSVIQLYPNDVFADRSRLQIAQIVSSQKDYRSANDSLTAVLNRRSDDIAAEALNMIGDNFLLMKKYTDALQAYNDVIRQYTDYPLMIDRARMGLGESYEKLRDRKQARASYEKLVATAVDPVLKNEAQQRLKKLRR